MSDVVTELALLRVQNRALRDALREYDDAAGDLVLWEPRTKEHTAARNRICALVMKRTDPNREEDS